jgi:4-amino-4-deoxy-L-arabinose transferase-like glycosyltransferase
VTFDGPAGGTVARLADGARAACLVLVAVSLILRLAYVDATPGLPLRHDAVDYDVHAQSIAVGEGFSEERAHGRPTAFRPPGYPYFLAGVYKLAGVERADDERRVEVARAANAILGALAVGLLALVAAQLWGPLVAVVAAALGAVYVPFITVGAAVMSEILFVVLMLAALAAALQHRRSPHRWRYVVVAGVFAGLAILSRPNAVVLLLPLAAAVWDGRPRRSRAALGPPVALVLVALLTVLPWTVRNAVELESFVPLSTQLGSALAGTYNDQARADRDKPASWRHIKHIPEHRDLWRAIRTIPEPDLERRLRACSLDFIADHPLYVGEVAFWNSARLADLTGRAHSRATAATINIDRRWADRGVVCFWVFAVLALAAAFTARARGAPRFLWAMPALLIASVVFLVVETPRYRTPLDPFVVLLAALAVSAAVEAVARGGRRRNASRHVSASGAAH